MSHNDILGGRLGYFLFFSARGGGRGSPRRREGGGGPILLKIPGGGGGSPGGVGAGRVSAANWRIWRGVGLNIFFRGRNVLQAYYAEICGHAARAAWGDKHNALADFAAVLCQGGTNVRAPFERALGSS